MGRDIARHQFGLPLQFGLGLHQRRLDLAALGADHVLLLLPLAREHVLVTRPGLGQHRLGAGYLGSRGDGIDDEQAVALLHAPAALDGTFDQPSGDRRRDQAGFALDIAEIAPVIRADTDHQQQTVAPDDVGDEQRGHEGHDDDQRGAFHATSPAAGRRACSMRSA